MSTMKFIKGFWQKIAYFYMQGFKSMTVGRTLWKIILIKVFVIVFVFKFFFFPDILDKVYKNDSQKAQHVLEALATPPSSPIQDHQDNETQHQYLSHRR